MSSPVIKVVLTTREEDNSCSLKNLQPLPAAQTVEVFKRHHSINSVLAWGSGDLWFPGGSPLWQREWVRPVYSGNLLEMWKEQSPHPNIRINKVFKVSTSWDIHMSYNSCQPMSTMSMSGKHNRTERNQTNTEGLPNENPQAAPVS